MRKTRKLKHKHTELLLCTSSWEYAASALRFLAKKTKQKYIAERFKPKLVKIIRQGNTCLVGPLNNPYHVYTELEAKKVPTETPVAITVK